MNLNQFLLILKARKKIILSTLFIVVIITTIVSLIIPKTYEATAFVLVDSQRIDSVTGMQQPPAQLSADFLVTQVDIITSHNVAVRVVDNLKIADDPEVRQEFQRKADGRGNIKDWIADELLLKKLYVQPLRDSNVIEISYTGIDPESTAVVTNAFVDAYIQTNLDLKIQPAKQAAAWYDTQLKVLRDNVEKSQMKLAEYQKIHDIVISGVGGAQGENSNLMGGQIDTESARLGALATQLVIAQAQSYDSTSKSRNSGKDLADVMNSPMVQSTNASLVQSEAKLSQLAATEGVNNPEYRSALDEVNKLRQELASQIQLARHSVSTNAGVAQQSVAELRAALDAQKQRVLALKNEQDEGAVLMREADNAQRTYDAAMLTLSQFKLQSKANQTDISVLSPAIVPIKHSSPKILLNIIISIFLGGLLGLGFGMVMEMTDRRVRSLHDLVSELTIPVLGVITSNQVLNVRGHRIKRIAA